MAQKKHVFGCVVSWDVAGGSSYTGLSDLKSMAPPMVKRGTADVTVMDSTARWKRFIKGMLEGGSPTFTVFLHKTQYNTLFNAMIDSADTIPTWKFAIGALSGESTASNWTFAGIITDMTPPPGDIGSEAAWECSLTVQVDGAVTFTSGS